MNRYIGIIVARLAMGAGVLGVYALIGSPLKADTILYNLTNVQTADGTDTVQGSFTYNTASGVASNFAITVNAGAIDGIAAISYANDQQIILQDNADGIWFTEQNAGQELKLEFERPGLGAYALTLDAADSFISDASGSFSLTGGVTDPPSAPEPGTASLLLLTGLGAAASAWLRRRSASSVA